MAGHFAVRDDARGAGKRAGADLVHGGITQKTVEDQNDRCPEQTEACQENAGPFHGEILCVFERLGITILPANSGTCNSP